jgi:hypothetical protein
VHRKRARAHGADGIDNERDAGDVIQMRVGKKNMVDQRQLGKLKLADPGTGVDQDVMVEQHRRGAQMSATDAAAATQNP